MSKEMILLTFTVFVAISKPLPLSTQFSYLSSIFHSPLRRRMSRLSCLVVSMIGLSEARWDHDFPCNAKMKIESNNTNLCTFKACSGLPPPCKKGSRQHMQFDRGRERTWGATSVSGASCVCHVCGRCGEFFHPS